MSRITTREIIDRKNVGCSNYPDYESYVRNATFLKRWNGVESEINRDPKEHEAMQDDLADIVLKLDKYFRMRGLKWGKKQLTCKNITAKYEYDWMNADKFILNLNETIFNHSKEYILLICSTSSISYKYYSSKAKLKQSIKDEFNAYYTFIIFSSSDTHVVACSDYINSVLETLC